MVKPVIEHVRAFTQSALYALIFSLPLLAWAGHAAIAADEGLVSPEKIFFQADNLAYDQNANAIVAEGHVEAIYQDRMLFADKVIYNQDTGIVRALGSVVLTDPEGNTLFAKEAQLSDDLREGIIQGIGLRLADDSAMAANEARRRDDRYTELHYAVYSPCEICPEKGKTVPTWQIKARQVTHDQEAQRITYNHAFLEAFGVPVLYTPYLSHPDPGVKRKSGFLAPSFGSSSELGTKVEVPYYWSISPSRDLTFSPLYTSREGPVLKGEYRTITPTGRYEFSGSLTRVDERDDQDSKTGDKETRGHIFGRGLFAADPHTLWGFTLERTTDDTYLSRYDLTDIDTLTSQLFAERIEGRNYGGIDFFLFQGLNKDDDPGLTPMILPLLQYSAVGEPQHYGGRLSFDANALVLRRSDGADTHRLSLTGGWQRDYISTAGGIYTMFANLRGDAYYLTDQGPQNSDETVQGRALPQIGMEWRLPLARHHDTVSQIVEPIAQLIYSPYGGNPSSVPNEDSGSFEFDDTNLFSTARFPGLDRWEGGPRANVGMKWGAYNASGGAASVLVGQVFRLKEDSTFAPETGLDDQRSDYVGRIKLSPTTWFDLVHRFRLDRETLDYSRSEVDLAAGPENFRLEVGYVRLARELTNAALIGREEFSARLNFDINDDWSARASTRRDLAQNSTVSNRAGLFYSDECIDFGFTYDRRFTRDRDVEPSTSFGFKIALRNLG